MTDTRKLPHKSISPEMGQYLLTSETKFVQEAGARVSSGENDANLAIQFNTLAQRMAELACIKYFFTAAPPGEVLDMFGKAALACANLFRLLGNDNSSVQIEWGNVKRSVPVLPHIDLQHSGKVEFGLELALLSDRSNDLVFLSGLNQENHTHEDIIQSDFLLNYTQFLQYLYVRNDQAAKRLGASLRDQLPSGSNPDVEFTQSQYRLFLAIPDRDPEQLVDLLKDLLKKHKKLFDSDRNNMRGSIMGLISLHALAAILLLH